MDVRFDQDTVWLTRQQMAELFGRDRSVVTRHIRNAYRERELDPKVTSAKFARVQSEDGRSVSREVDHYNLDMIISVGYRVKSLRGTQFRIWATRTLREHLVSGYTLNERRLAERGLDEARQTLKLLARTLKNQALVDETGQSVLDLITMYADTWRLLLEYDEDRLATPAGAKPATSALDLDTAVTAIETFRRDLAAKGQATPLFGNRRGMTLDCRSSLPDTATQYRKEPISLAPTHDQRRRKHRLISNRPYNQPLLPTSLKHLLSHPHPGIEGRLALLVLHVLDADHEMTAPHVSDDRQIAQCLCLFEEVRSDVTYSGANVLTLDYLDVLQGGSTSYRVT